MNSALKMVLIILACLVAGGVAVGAVIAGVIESDRSSAGKTGPTVRPTEVSSLSVVRPTATSSQLVKTPAPAPTEAPSEPLPEFSATAPEVIQTVQAAPADVTPSGSAKTCPGGVVAGGLTEISLRPAPEYGVDYVAITGRGVIHNATDAPVTFFDGDIPDVLGLNERGETHILLTQGPSTSCPRPVSRGRRP
ncbi:hypothetical protein ACW0JT_20525 [Arthrobacter sp. SA17]